MIAHQKGNNKQSFIPSHLDLDPLVSKCTTIPVNRCVISACSRQYCKFGSKIFLFPPLPKRRIPKHSILARRPGNVKPPVVAERGCNYFNHRQVPQGIGPFCKRSRRWMERRYLRTFLEADSGGRNGNDDYAGTECHVLGGAAISVGLIIRSDVCVNERRDRS